MKEIRPGTVSVPAGLAGQRLDRALASLVPGVSRARIQELIADGGVQVDGRAVSKPSTPVEAGAQIELLDVPRTRLRAGGPATGELRVVHEDRHLAVIDKPAGMVSHPSTVVRGGTVSERAVERWGPLPAPQGPDRPGIVHRLDADTSGLMVIALTEEAATGLLRLFQERAVEKEYLALVFGDPRFDSDWIELPIGRAPGRPDRMTVVEPGEGRAARTFYETRERFGDFALVACRPETGRTHQIRVHLAAIDHPVVGDRVYRGRKGLRRAVPAGAPPMVRHALHASRLRFVHPVTGEVVELRADLAEDMGRWLEWLRTSRGPGPRVARDPMDR